MTEPIPTTPPVPVDALLFDPFSEEFRIDPYPYYHRLRAERPFHYHPAGFWILTRHADCDQILRDRRFEPLNPHDWNLGLDRNAAPAPTTNVHGFLRRMMLFGPTTDHRRLRGPLSRAFAPRNVDPLRPRIRAVANELIDAFPTRAPFDFMEAFGSPFPMWLTLDVIGLPSEDRGRLAQWALAFSPLLDPMQRPDAIENAARMMERFRTYMLEFLQANPTGPPQGILRQMMEPDAEGNRLTLDELISNIGFLLGAGHDTAMHLMGNGLWTLLRTPEAWSRLRDEPGLLSTGVDELLRYESPAQMTVRNATADVLVGRRLIRQGQRVLLLLGAANRDPERFPAPDRFDPARTPNDHLAFSGGAHYCLGSHLAKMEGEEAFTALAERAPSIRLTGRWEWQRTLTLRGFEHLEVAT